ncbi:Sorting nexin, cytoplasm-to-vacuole targeting pathway/endosomal sorting [Apophysomyces sp. BC1034]|nr:Sorting nexin, cytoplasm-to-vacuole targeting pathway/endosomal sorting [Apophysomyces sp. BC1015]KAG0177574.1 Sorting nexin, cytoplasm-to-vacuole targeting pathway/endosomal sorting [Apophysomyces sp. BC1021]KAG0191153.1 Sorting nexin, cytoplasm-to-vacuole targeting pathway/endosomal sorting [Apophysomyces sp. BC1034]
MIVPPIPEKHSLVDYAALQTRVKDDLSMIEKRKRMLQTFLNRVAKHPELGRDHVFHRFLENGVLWSDVLHSPPLSVLPKNPLQAVVSKQADLPPHSTVLSNTLIPIPTTAYTLKNPDPRFEESEKFTYRIANYMNNNLDKSQRKVIRRLGELANDYAELGAVYNGFSLNESDAVAHAIEKIGQAVDASYTETGQMVTALEGEFAEPIQEHSQFAQTVKQVLRFRHLKHAQVELIEGSLENKEENLKYLLQMEQEARRLEEAITRERTIGSNAVDIDEINEAANNPVENGMPYGNAGRRPKSWGNPIQMISAVGHTLQGIIDVDPEATRRNQIGKTKDAMEVLQNALEITRKDLAGVSVDVQKDLDRFQREKIRDLRDMLIAYAKIHIRYCQKNLESWQEARTEIEKIPI